MADPRSEDADGIQAGDVVALRKTHPCGEVNWEITRVGADIGLRCLGCDRVIMLSRHEFRRRVRRFVRRAEDHPG
ncbi:MAG: DUF951 domain-containing protein [Dehalococcoidia bacterium]|nr:DUF951 domain-containing protein [Dehalococcoidia bacterium]